MGCHIESSGAFLGRVSAPFSSDFVHVSEQATEPCDGGTCFGISEALRTVFLPHRSDVLRNFIDSGLGCDKPSEPAGDAGVAGGDAGTIGGGPVSAIARGVRTLGGQPVVEHPH